MSDKALLRFTSRRGKFLAHPNATWLGNALFDLLPDSPPRFAV